MSYLHPLLMILIVFPVGFAAASFGITLQQVRLERSRRKISLKIARDRHIANGTAFLVAVVGVALIGGLATANLPKNIDTTWHGIGALSILILLSVSTALVSIRPLKRLPWSKFVHSVLNGTVLALLMIQFLSGGFILRQLFKQH
jgi:hypothetical protein